jgi:hypothetical protein
MMDYLRNKPRVFLSHSKADIGFIERAGNDLRGCQIEPWLDSQEIRAGQPWLDAIFESGIPTCDCVFVYLTESSIDSTMVKKEIDAGIIRKLRDSQIAFLPYVSRAELRDKLRTDLQTLQVPEWNENNYHLMLPRVVAEIWRSYMDRTIVASTKDEKVKRLEAELELAKIRKEAKERIFSEGEDLDFKYIQKSMDRWEPVIFSMDRRTKDRQDEVIQEASYKVNLLALLLFFVRDGSVEINDSFVPGRVINMLWDVSPELQKAPEGLRLVVSQAPRLEDDLLMFGLIERKQFMQSFPKMTASGDVQYHQQVKYGFEFTGKVQRFRYWLAVNGLMPQETRLQPDKPFEAPRP